MSDANDEALLGRLVGALAPVPGIEAIALGGARASTQGALAELSARRCAASFSPQETWEERWRD